MHQSFHTVRGSSLVFPFSHVYFFYNASTICGDYCVTQQKVEWILIPQLLDLPTTHLFYNVCSFQLYSDRNNSQRFNKHDVLTIYGPAVMIKPVRTKQVIIKQERFPFTIVLPKIQDMKRRAVSPRSYLGVCMTLESYRITGCRRHPYLPRNRGLHISSQYRRALLISGGEFYFSLWMTGVPCQQ